MPVMLRNRIDSNGRRRATNGEDEDEHEDEEEKANESSAYISRRLKISTSLQTKTA